jgi:hypothetical protein
MRLAYTMYVVFSGLVTIIFIARKTKTKFDDLLTNKTAKYIAHLPLLFI